MYHAADNHICFQDFQMPEKSVLNRGNRWVKLAGQIPWLELDADFGGLLKMEPKPALRLALGVYMIQTEYGYSCEETVLQIQENAYLQFFCGFHSFNDSRPPMEPEMVDKFRTILSFPLKGELGARIALYFPDASNHGKSTSLRKAKLTVRTPACYPQLSPGCAVDAIKDSGFPMASELSSLQLEKAQVQLLRSQFVIRLVGGKFHSKEEIEYHAHCLHLDIGHKYWVVMQLVYSDKIVLPAMTEQTLEICQAISVPHGNCLATEYIGHPGVCILLQFDCIADPEAFVKNFADTLSNHILNSGITPFRIGISAVCTSPMEICRASYEADAAMGTACSQNQRLCFFEIEQATLTDASSLSDASKLMLVSAISRSDEDMALCALNELLHYIEEYDRSFLITRLHCSELSSLLIETIQKLDLPYQQENWTDLFIYNDVNYFGTTIRTLTQTLCRQVLQRQELENIREKTRILTFIEHNFHSSNFSLDLAADSLSITKSKISSIIKEDLGMGFSQYLSLLRLNEVKRQLVETEKLIQDIIRGVGYLDVPNFSRRFKTLEGMTPGQYRDRHMARKATPK